MALTATVGVSNSSVSTGERVQVTITATNTGASDLTVSSVIPQVLPRTSAFNIGDTAGLRGVIIPAGGSVGLPFGVVFYDQPQISGAANPMQQHTVSGMVLCTDGTTGAAPTAVAYVNVTPITTPTTATPTRGQMRADSNFLTGCIDTFF